MTVTKQYVTGITDVDPVRKVSDVFTADTSKELSLLAEYHYTMTLKRKMALVL